MRLRLIGRLARWREAHKLCGIWLALMITFAPWANAATYYVNVNTGDDGNDGLSSDNPFKTIGKAMQVAGATPADDTVHVGGGIYADATEDFPLDLPSGVALIGQQAGSVVLIAVTSGGTGYTSMPTVGFTGGGGFGASAVAWPDETGAIEAVVVTDPGSGYDSAPEVSITGGGGTGATAAAVVGPSIVGRGGTSTFRADSPLSATTRVSGFALTHDSPDGDNRMFEFAIPAGAMAPRIDHNAFISDLYNGDGIVYYDGSASDGSFTGVFEDNTFHDMDEPIIFTSGSPTGGAGDVVTPTIRNNTFHQAWYPVNFTMTISQGGHVGGLMEGNTMYDCDHGVYIYGILGEDFSTFDVTINNNTFRKTDTYGVYSSMTAFSGEHTWSPSITNNTIVMDDGEGISLNCSINSSEAGDQTIAPVITGNTIDGTPTYGIDITMSTVSVMDGATVNWNPTISNNTIRNASSYAIYLTLSDVMEGNFVSNQTISGNRIEDSSSVYVEVSYISYDDIDGFDTDIAITNNTITDGTSYGIYATIVSLSGPSAGQMNLTISGNEITGTDSTAAYVFFEPYGGHVDANITVDGNTLSESDWDGLYLSIWSAGDGEQNVLVRGNTITDNDDDGIALSMSTQSALSAAENRIAGNVITGNGDDGIDVNVYNEAATDLIISCNTITNNHHTGVFVGDVSSVGSGRSPVNLGDLTADSPGRNIIHDNTGEGTWDVWNDSAWEVQALNNWWGTTNEVTIESHLYDDTPAGKGEVVFSNAPGSGYLTSESDISHSFTTDVAGSVAVDTDGSGGPSVGDTLRFCTTITGGETCGTGRGVTVTIPIPPNTTLVEGSASLSSTSGTLAVGTDELTVTSLVLGPGQSASICFETVADSGTSVEVTADAEGPDASGSDTAIVVLAAAVAAVSPIYRR